MKIIMNNTKLYKSYFKYSKINWNEIKILIKIAKDNHGIVIRNSKANTIIISSQILIQPVIDLSQH